MCVCNFERTVVVVVVVVAAAVASLIMIFRFCFAIDFIVRNNR